MEDATFILREIVRRTLRLFRSVKLSASIIITLILLYFLGLIIPQKALFDSHEHYRRWVDEHMLNRFLDAINFTDIYLSPLTLLLLAVFFVNLLVVISGRVPIVMKKTYLVGAAAAFGAEDIRGTSGEKAVLFDMPLEDAWQSARKYFKKQRWRVIDGRGTYSFLAVKNRFSPIGFLLFHISFLLCLAGGLAINYTRFSGNLVLTEGQGFDGDMRQFRVIHKEPRFFKTFPPLALYLQEVRPRYEKDTPTDLAVILKVFYGGETRVEEMKVNEPLQKGPFSILLQDLGVSPLFEVLGPSGQVIDAAYVSLNVLKGTSDTFRFSTDRRYVFHVSFYPDYTRESGIEKTRSLELKNPAVHLFVEKNGLPVYEGTLKSGEYADIEPFKLRFSDVRYWADFQLVREYGKFPLVTGFLFAASGLIMKLVFYQKRIRVVLQEQDGKSLLSMDGKSEQFPHAFSEEMEKVFSELSALTDGTVR